MEEMPQLHGIADVGQDGRNVGAVAGLERNAQSEHRQNGADGAERHQTKAVVRGMAVGTDGGHADTQRHDERNGDGAGGHAAGIKGHGKKFLWHKGGQHKDEPVEHHQQLGQGNAQQHTQEGDHEEQPHACRHREDEGHVGDGGHLIGQYL